MVEEEIPDAEEQAYIESIETNPFFTRIYAEVPESMKIGEYRYVLCTEEGEECEPCDVFFGRMKAIWEIFILNHYQKIQQM